MSEIIMRMCGRYIDTLNSQPEDCRDGSLAMVEAVKELRDILDDIGDKEGDKETSFYDVIPRGLMAWRAAGAIDKLVLGDQQDERTKNNP